MPIITLDFETYWDNEYTLSKMGPISYIRDRRFSVQLLGMRVDKGPVMVFEGENIVAALNAVRLDRPDVTTVGHNINGFDALVLAEHYGVVPSNIVDTMCLMRISGLSRMMCEQHKTLTAFLENGVKTDGTEISKGKQWPNDFTEEERNEFIRYCINDVLQCSDNYTDLIEYCSPELVKFCSLTAGMALRPSLVVDVDRVEKYIQSLDDAAEKAREKLSAMFHLANREEFYKNIRSASKFGSMLRRLGVDAPMKLSEKKTETMKAKLEAAAQSGDAAAKRALANGDYEVFTPALSKNDLEFTELLEHENPAVRELVAMRLEHNSSIQRSRAVRLADIGKTGGLPVMLNALKADTGRYTAGNSEGSTDGLNMQNMSKRDPNQLELRRCVKAPAGHVIVAVDSSQIEARMLAWFAGQNDLVEQFRSGRDPYAELASVFSKEDAKAIREGAKSGDKHFKTLRNAGKTAILSCGYGVGWRKYALTLKRSGCLLSQDPDEHDRIAQEIHSVYRRQNSFITSFWKLCDGYLEAMFRGASGSIACGVEYGTYDMLPNHRSNKRCCGIRMPNGFTIWYPNLRPVESTDGGFEWVFDRWRGKGSFQQKIYGGMVTENIIQSASFMLLAWQALQMEADGLRLAGNIHDCWFAVVPESEGDATLALMTKHMSSVPEWLDGFPVACEGEIGIDYTVA